MTRSHAPLVSVVIPTYDRPSLLRRAVRSVDEQTYEHIELVVVDGPSDTPAERVTDGLDLSVDVKHVRHSTLQGLSAARNAGIDRAGGDHIAFLDDDDEWRQTKIAKQVERMSDGSVGAVYTGIEQLDSNGRTNAIKTATVDGNALPSLFQRNFIGSPSCVMVQVAVLDAVDGFDEELPHWEDWDLYLKIADHSTFGSVPEPLVRRHTHGDQMSEDIEIKQSTSAERIFQKHKHLTHDYEGWDEPRFRAAIEFYLAESAFTHDLFGAAKTHLLNAIRTYPFEPKWYFYLLLVSGGRFTFRPAQRAKRLLVRLRNDRPSPR